MKRKKFVSAIALTLALVCAFTLGANASSTLQEIKAYLNSGITIKLDGEEQILKNADGSRIFPITYGGTTYLPVRAVSNMLGIDVDWDGATRTVILGKKITTGVDLIDTYKAYYFGGYSGQRQTPDGYVEEISGITCDHFLWFASSQSNSVSFNLKGKHDTLTLSYYSPVNATLTVMGDNETVLGEYTITGGTVAQTVTIPLYKTQELKLQMTLDSSAQARIFNAYLDVKQ